MVPLLSIGVAMVHEKGVAGQRAVPGVTAEAVSGRQQAEAQSAQNEKKFRDQFLEANKAEELAVVKTDSGMTMRFYNPGVYNQPPVEVDPLAVNVLTNFAIASLTSLEQSYLSKPEITTLQARAAAGQLDNVDVAVLFCYDAYNRLPDQSGQSLQKTDCGANGWAVGDRIGTRTSPNKHYPTLMASWWIRGDVGGDHAQVLSTRFPSALAPGVTEADVTSQLVSSGPLDRSQVMTSIVLHELGHGLAGLIRTGAEYHAEREHVEVVSPLQRLGDALMAKVPSVQNPTPYDLQVAFGINGDPIGQERERLVAAGAPNFYPTRPI